MLEKLTSLLLLLLKYLLTLPTQLRGFREAFCSCPFNSLATAFPNDTAAARRSFADPNSRQSLVKTVLWRFPTVWGRGKHVPPKVFSRFLKAPTKSKSSNDVFVEWARWSSNLLRNTWKKISPLNGLTCVRELSVTSVCY